MDGTQFIDYLIPIIFLVVWVISGLFGKRVEEEMEQQEPVDRGVDPFEDLFEAVEEEPTIEPELEEPVNRMEEYQEELHRLEQAAEAAARQAAAITKQGKPAYQAEHKARHGGQLAWIRKGGKRVLKRAIVEMEVLGTPVGMRQQGKMGPMWDQ